MANEIRSRITVRLDAETARKLQKMVEQTGKNKSEVIVSLINQECQTHIIDGSEIATGLHELHLILKQERCVQEARIKVENLCDLLTDKIYEVFEDVGV